MQKLTIDESKIEIKIERQVKVQDILIDVPLRYKCNAINAIFPISTKKAKEIIKTDKIKPLEIWPGKSLLCITLFDFFKAAVGPYTEMTLSIPVKYKPKFIMPSISMLMGLLSQKIDFFVMQIAQSSQMAIEHGLAITGYPRYSLTELVNVDFREDENFIYANVLSSGEKILDLKIKKPSEEKIKKELYDTYFIKDNNINKIKMETHGIVGKSKVQGFELGHHKWANFIKKLQIYPKSIDTRYYRDTIKIVNSPKILEGL
jgi:hypothetical protein